MFCRSWDVLSCVSAKECVRMLVPFLHSTEAEVIKFQLYILTPVERPTARCGFKSCSLVLGLATRHWQFARGFFFFPSYLQAVLNFS